VLLNLYRYSPATSTLLLEILKQVSRRLWLPHQVAKEYHNNRLGVITHQLGAYNDIEEHLQKTRDQMESKLETYRRHPYIDISRIISQVDSLFKKVSKELNSSKREHPDLHIRDNIRDEVTHLFEDRVGDPFDNNRLNEIYKEGEERYNANIPPGYIDTKNKEGSQKFGDLVLWLQIIEKAKEQDKPIILITDDAKEDWWWKHKGRIIGPHPLLVEEFQTRVQQHFYMYSSDKFMEYSRKFLRQEVNEKAIEEVRGIRQLDELLSSRRQYLLEELVQLREQYGSIHRAVDDVAAQIAIVREQTPSTSSNTETEEERLQKQIQHQEALNSLHLRLDSLIAVREETHRRASHIRTELAYMNEQAQWLQKYDSKQSYS